MFWCDVLADESIIRFIEQRSVRADMGAYCASCSICGMEATHKENELWLCEKHYTENQSTSSCQVKKQDSSRIVVL
jgi:hypothetical protein